MCRKKFLTYPAISAIIILPAKHTETKGHEMTIDHNDFLRVRDNIIERFEECDEKSYDSLSDCVDESLIYNADILAVVVELMPTNDAINGYTLAALAYDLMYDYVLENGYVECVDD